MLVLKLSVCCILIIYVYASDVKGKGGFYAYSVKNIDGETESLEKYRGKVSLVVNVASECGYTDVHYEQLVQLQNELAVDEEKPFTVLAFPCNQFGQQEPYDNAHILSHVKNTYGVNFPVFGKLLVHDHDAHPVYQFLARNSGSEPKWNFWKYLVNEMGLVVGSWGPRVDVVDIKDDILDTIKKIGATHSEL